MFLNLMLAAVWLIAACAAFTWPLINPHGHGLVIVGTKISAGWLFLGLAVYNLARWWMSRSYRAAQQRFHENTERRDREHRNEPPREPDPTFDFTRDDPPGQNTP